MKALRCYGDDKGKPTNDGASAVSLRHSLHFNELNWKDHQNSCHFLVGGWGGNIKAKKVSDFDSF